MNILIYFKIILIQIKNHYLEKTSVDGYYFKFGSIQTNNNFLNAFALLVDKPLIEIQKIMESKLKNNNSLFISLNNGEIKNVFININNYVNYITNSPDIRYDYVIDILSEKKVEMMKDIIYLYLIK